MHWEGLFADLEAQADALEVAERAGEVTERARIETARLRLLDRLRAGVGLSLGLSCLGAVELRGQLRRVGPDWVLIDEGGGRETVIVLAAVTRVSGLGRLAGVPDSEGVVESRLGLPYALRMLARDRAAVRLHLIDATVLDGTLDRIGADFAELAAHPPAEARRRSQVREVVAVPLSAVAAVRRG